MKTALKRTTALLLCVGCLFSCSLVAKAQAPVTELAQSNQPYTFTVVPGTSEWNTLANSQEMVAACYIPQQTIENMSTEALLETVLDYPLLIDIFAYDSTNLGIEMASKYLPGLPELLSRSDALQAVGAYMASYPQNSTEIKYQYCEAFVHYLIPPTWSALRAVIDGTVYTPAGTRVPVLIFNSWNDYTAYMYHTQADVEEQEAYLRATYVQATRLESYTYRYNCHAYAWSPDLYTNGFWMEDPSAYMTDGSYTEGQNALGAVITYMDDDFVTHSGRMTGTGTVTSKWGANGLFSHPVTHCPYYNAGVQYTYWHLN